MYCGTASDITQGKLAALGPRRLRRFAPTSDWRNRTLRGSQVVCCGFMIRSCMVEG